MRTFHWSELPEMVSLRDLLDELWSPSSPMERALRPWRDGDDWLCAAGCLELHEARMDARVALEVEGVDGDGRTLRIIDSRITAELNAAWKALLLIEEHFDNLSPMVADEGTGQPPRPVDAGTWRSIFPAGAWTLRYAEPHEADVQLGSPLWEERTLAQRLSGETPMARMVDVYVDAGAAREMVGGSAQAPAASTVRGKVATVAEDLRSRARAEEMECLWDVIKDACPTENSVPDDLEQRLVRGGVVKKQHGCRVFLNADDAEIGSITDDGWRRSVKSLRAAVDKLT